MFLFVAVWFCVLFFRFSFGSLRDFSLGKVFFCWGGWREKGLWREIGGWFLNVRGCMRIWWGRCGGRVFSVWCIPFQVFSKRRIKSVHLCSAIQCIDVLFYGPSILFLSQDTRMNIRLTSGFYRSSHQPFTGMLSLSLFFLIASYP